jgi:hypothetical protein
MGKSKESIEKIKTEDKEGQAEMNGLDLETAKRIMNIGIKGYEYTTAGELAMALNDMEAVKQIAEKLLEELEDKNSYFDPEGANRKASHINSLLHFLSDKDPEFTEQAKTKMEKALEKLDARLVSGGQKKRNKEI